MDWSDRFMSGSMILCLLGCLVMLMACVFGIVGLEYTAQAWLPVGGVMVITSVFGMIVALIVLLLEDW